MSHINNNSNKRSKRSFSPPTAALAPAKPYGPPEKKKRKNDKFACYACILTQHTCSCLTFNSGKCNRCVEQGGDCIPFPARSHSVCSHCQKKHLRCYGMIANDRPCFRCNKLDLICDATPFGYYSNPPETPPPKQVQEPPCQKVIHKEAKVNLIVNQIRRPFAAMNVTPPRKVHWMLDEELTDPNDEDAMNLRIKLDLDQLDDITEEQ